MSTRMLARRMFQRQIVAGVDGVLFGVWLPSETRVQEVTGYVNLETLTMIDSLSICMGAVEGWVLPVDDPDAGIVMDTIWDRYVPKDQNADTIDLDTVASDVAAFYEPGMVTWEFVIPMGNMPTRVFHSHFLSSMGYNTLHQDQDNQTPFGRQFIGGKRITLRLNQPVYVKTPHLLAFAIGSPLTTETSSANALLGFIESDWGQIRYIDHVMERAMLTLLGLEEAGAETPWEEAAQLLRKHLDPAVLETTSGAFVPVTWRASGEAAILHSVEGKMPNNLISTGR